MKRRLLPAFGIIILVIMGFATSPAEAASGVGPYYPMPAWDQTIACTTPAPCPRFIVLTNMGSAAVLDRETGLVWEQSPNTNTFDWYGALYYCNNLTTGNRKGWRLPTAQELASLVDPSVAYPELPLPSGHPFAALSAPYWTSTTKALPDYNSLYALTVNFSTGGVVDGYIKSSLQHFWCARGGQGVDPQ